MFHSTTSSEISREPELIVLSYPSLTLPTRNFVQTTVKETMAMNSLRESAKKGLRIGMIAGDGIGRNVLPVRLHPSFLSSHHSRQPKTNSLLHSSLNYNNRRLNESSPPSQESPLPPSSHSMPASNTSKRLVSPCPNPQSTH